MKEPTLKEIQNYLKLRYKAKKANKNIVNNVGTILSIKEESLNIYDNIKAGYFDNILADINSIDKLLESWLYCYSTVSEYKDLMHDVKNNIK